MTSAMDNNKDNINKKYHLRECPKQKFNGGDDDVWMSQMINSNRDKNNGNLVCSKCQSVFKTRKILAVHEQSCLKLGAKDSFLKYVQQPQVVLCDIGPKVAAPCSQENEIVSDSLSNGSHNNEIERDENNNLHDPPSEQIPQVVTNGNIDEDEDACCPLCKAEVASDQDGVHCNMCSKWCHKTCLNLSDEEYEILKSTPDTPWFCARCLSIKANNIKWGEYEGEAEISSTIKTIYEEILNWKHNIFPLPRGKSGTDLVKEIDRLVNLFVRKTGWERLALSLLHIFLPLMLQKPSAKSKPREHAKYLTTRLERWRNGELKSLMAETTEIQKRLRKAKSGKEESREKAFIRLMMLGKLGPAAKYVNNDDDIKGVHPLTSEIKEILESKHPAGREVDPEIIYEITAEMPQPVIYEEITSDVVYKVVKNMNGAGGPTLIDSDVWKNILCSKVYGNSSRELCQSIADLAKIMCTEEIHPDCLNEFNACRLIPLDKGLTKDLTPGVRPIGIGEVLRRIVGKLVVGVIRDDIMEAAGPLQTCTGLKGGIEAAIHAMRITFEKEETEGILLVDAENAFNNLNRKAALQNIKQICPSFYQYLYNTYQKPAKLIIKGDDTHEVIYSREGSTQGGVGAMGLYGLGVKPLVDNLGNEIDIEKCIQSWYADDSSSAGELIEMWKWWDTLCIMGPKYGYFPLATKTVLIVKEEHKSKALEIFGETGVKITTEGERQMGAVIGSNEFKLQYIGNKVAKWVQDVLTLAEIAKDEPQLAYSSFTKSISHRWTYIQRTVPDIAQLFEPLENAIRESLIPALIGRKVNDIERLIFELPVKLGGLGLYNPIKTADTEFLASSRITANLTSIICNQEKDLINYDKDAVEHIVKEVKAEKEKAKQDAFQSIYNQVGEKMKRILKLSQEKGAGSWLTTSPVKSLGFSLNKQEFRDGICLRYGWRVPHTSSHCLCGKKNDTDHALSCKKGGYVIMRHNRIRDLEAELMREVCTDVRIEPHLLPLANENLVDGNQAENARLDVSGNGIWGPMQKTFLDVRVVHPNCPSYQNKDIAQVYKTHEQEKKRTYNERIIQVEKGSFTPIVVSTFGGMGQEAESFHKRLALLISEKRNESYSHVVNYIRTRLRFCLLRSVLTSIRGVRGKTRNENIIPVSSLSFNLIRFDD